MIAGILAGLFAIAAVPAGQRFPCTPVRVWDGDGPIWCAEGPRVRLAGIAARELDGTCKPHHPCPAMSGIAARDILVGLLGGKRGTMGTGHIIVKAATMACRSFGDAKGGRTAASCALPGVGDLGSALIARRAALRWRVFRR